jgi:hypothetical protein
MPTATQVQTQGPGSSGRERDRPPEAGDLLDPGEGASS